ncbi:MAG: N-acetyltransferase [Alphaproteobacteria bacterium]|nr:N-acetyltransferase [Alphaproteobacteria bacterium]
MKSTPSARLLDGMAGVARATWDALANPPGAPFNPFVSHAFLAALEASGSATARTGWQPAHILVEQAGQPLAAAPMYVKNHSYGEYVFDHGWAQAFERAGGAYYPKLQVAAPFTPVTGPRLLTGGNPAAREPLAQAMMTFAQKLGVSSLHITFLPQEDVDALLPLGFLQRHDQQFHWHNQGYASFADFLGQLSSIKRKNLRRERAEALSPGIEVEWLSGRDLTEAHWDAFFAFYMDTGSRKWGSPYLTREFFSLIGDSMADQILLIMAKRNGRYIAGALNFIGSDALYGRNWGALEHHPFLHFELCYYQAIDFAIAKGLKVVEAGAQGAHKLARGYLPVRTQSAHWIAHPGLRDAVARYLKEERRAVGEEMEALAEHSPFKNTETP